MKTLRLAVLATAVAVAAPLSGQAHEHAAGDHHDGPPPYITAIAGDIADVERKVIALAEAMPESSWNWRPGEGVRSVGEVYMHIAADNYYIPALAGVAAPASTGITADSYQSAVAYEEQALDKAATIAALRASFAHVREALDGVGHDDLHAEYSVFGNPMTGIQVWLITSTHLHEHLGQSIAYARTNGVVPPWSR